MAEGREVLFGEDFGGGHDACLIAVAYGKEHCHKGNDGLSASDVALYETVHLTSALHILVHLAYYALLCLGELEREVMVVEVIEICSYVTEDVTLDCALPESCVSQDCQLDVEEFFELEPVACQ